MLQKRKQILNGIKEPKPIGIHRILFNCQTTLSKFTNYQKEIIQPNIFHEVIPTHERNIARTQIIFQFFILARELLIRSQHQFEKWQKLPLSKPEDILTVSDADLKNLESLNLKQLEYISPKMKILIMQQLLNFKEHNIDLSLFIFAENLYYKHKLPHFRKVIVGNFSSRISISYKYQDSYFGTPNHSYKFSSTEFHLLTAIFQFYNTNKKWDLKQLTKMQKNSDYFDNMTVYFNELKLSHYNPKRKIKLQKEFCKSAYNCIDFLCGKK